MPTVHSRHIPPTHSRAHLLTAIAALLPLVLAGCEEKTRSECYHPFTPTGPVVESRCDCEDGVLYFCATAATCTGTIGATTCERFVFAAVNQHQFCDGCQVDFTDAGAIFVTCAADPDP